MHWEDEAFILAVGKYSETAAIVTLFSRAHGWVRSIAHGAMSRKQRGVYQPGNLVRTRWSARLSEHMGNVQAELLLPVAASAMSSSLALSGIGAVTSLIPLAVMEQDAHPRLFEYARHVLEHLAHATHADDWLADYARFELFLLQDAGYGLDLSECASTGSREDLCYVSPKSGRAVSRAAGEPYCDRMLPLPEFLTSDELPLNRVKPAEILDALRMTGYFLEHWMLAPAGRKLPAVRQRLVELIPTPVAA
jgi:DNA repair protein RecO (recombination protein O)